MPTLSDLPTPALVVDLDRLESNLAAMAAHATALGVALRPHVKTHKCVEIARRQFEAGARGLTVSTLYEARRFAAAGFDDLTWAFPVILGRLPEIRQLTETVRLGLVVDSPEAADALEADGFGFRVWLKVDCGYHRAGVDPARPAALELARRLSDSTRLEFAGLLTHSGHAYTTPGREALRRVAEEERSVMVEFAERLRAGGVAVPEVSVGSTPAMSAATDLTGVTEARPGNYAFYDHTQCRLGACGPADCAVTVLSTVVSSPPGATHSVVDAGALALSKDPGLETADRPPTFGEIYADYPAGRLDPDRRLTGLSQEHGLLSARLPVGSRLRILPNHSCLTVACFDEYAVARGDRVVDRWPVLRGRS